MRKNNRKGFTIVELVIVIAVIAILAAVLIPTFSGIVKKAQQSAAEQEATNAYKEAYALALSDGKIDSDDSAVKVTTAKGEWTFNFTDEKNAAVTPYTDFEYEVELKNGVLTVTE